MLRGRCIGTRFDAFKADTSRATAPLDVIHVIPGKAPQTADEQSGAEFAAAVERDGVDDVE